MNKIKFFESLLDEANFGTQFGKQGPIAKGHDGTAASPDLQWADDDLKHKDMLPWNDDDLKHWDIDTRKSVNNYIYNSGKDQQLKDEVEDFVADIEEKFPRTTHIGRIKSAVSLNRKASSADVGFSGLDDIIGFAVVFENKEDCDAAAKLCHDDDRIRRIYDYSYDDECGGYYAYHCLFNGGLGAEIQLITLRCLYAKEIYVHAGYECAREMGLKMESEPSKELFEHIEAVASTIKSCYVGNLKREGTKQPLAKPDVSILSEEQKEFIIENVRPETKERAIAYLYDMINPKEVEAHSLLAKVKNHFDTSYLIN